jgi:hypothetical protein
LVLIALVIGFFLPSKVHSERSTVIAAPPEAIFPLVNDLRQWPSWTAWNKERDATLDVKFSGAQEGKGAIYTWTSKGMGSGKLTLTESNPPSGVKYEMYFEDEKTPSTGEIKLDKVDAGTNVTWTYDGDMGNNPLKRYMGLMIDYFLGKDFETGLAKLKTVAEAKK